MTTTVPAAATGLTRRQAELLDQLEALFLAEGFARFTLEDLAVRLRCSKSTLYALAGSKEQLAARVIRHFFRKATDAVEARRSPRRDPALRVTAYLSAVAAALAPAGPAFHRDLDAFGPGREVYERNTALAADRVRELIADGRGPGPLPRRPPGAGRRHRHDADVPHRPRRHRPRHRSGRRRRLPRARRPAAARDRAVNGRCRPRWDDPDVQRLAADQQAEVRARYDGKGEPGTPPSAADISVVLVARADDGTALGLRRAAARSGTTSPR